MKDKLEIFHIKGYVFIQSWQPVHSIRQVLQGVYLMYLMCLFKSGNLYIPYGKCCKVTSFSA